MPQHSVVGGATIFLQTPKTFSFASEVPTCMCSVRAHVFKVDLVPTPQSVTQSLTMM